MSYYDSKANSAAILMVPPPSTVNPLHPQGHWLHDRLVGHVMQQGSTARGPKLELWTGSGQSAYYPVGAVVEAHHDQSRITKGFWTCIGVVRWTGTDEPAEVLEGEVPNRKLRQGVFK